VNVIQMSYKHYHPDEKSGICVVRRKGESIEDLIKRFKKRFSKSGITKELRERMYFEKPSNKKRRKKAQSIRGLEREEKKLDILKEKSKKKIRRKKRND
jgi:small subunit ribosomal protein S21